jgi:hypothetical protein
LIKQEVTTAVKTSRRPQKLVKETRSERLLAGEGTKIWRKTVTGRLESLVHGIGEMRRAPAVTKPDKKNDRTTGTHRTTGNREKEDMGQCSGAGYQRPVRKTMRGAKITAGNQPRIDLGHVAFADAGNRNLTDSVTRSQEEIVIWRREIRSNRTWWQKLKTWPGRWHHENKNKQRENHSLVFSTAHRHHEPEN